MTIQTETAPLGREFVDRVLEYVRSGQAIAGFGVTLQEDHNGAWGQLGKRYLTIRFADPKNKNDLVEVQMEISNVVSYLADKGLNAYLNEDK